MTKKKIAILGKGTAGSQAAVHFYRYFPDNEYEIDWYRDPNQPAQSVGEGSTLQLPTNLFHGIGFTHDDLKKIDGTLKTGIYKENWGTTNKSFFHDFVPPQVGYHFNAVKLQEYVEETLKNKVNIIDKAADYKNVDADFVLNASGTPKDFSDFHISEYIPVNAAYVTQCYWDGPKFDYTLCIVGKYGWVFGIPLQNRCSIGYMYNKDINTEEEVAEDVKEIFEKYGLTPSDNTNSLQFKNYYRKENYEDSGRIVHSGNASFFLEPLEATSISYMDRIHRTAHDLWSDAKHHMDANFEYMLHAHEVETVIMLHYAAGSPFKTEFWDFAQERGIKKLESCSTDYKLREIYSSTRDLSHRHLAEHAHTHLPDHGSWWFGAYMQNIAGLGVKKLMDDVFFNED